METATLELAVCPLLGDPVLAASDEALLLDYVASNNRDSFERLLRRYEREIFNYLRRYLGSEQLAEDAFQGTFLILHQKCGQFDPARKLRPWLYRIATNQANDLLRRGRRHKAVRLDSPGHASADGSDRLSLADIVAADQAQPGEALESAEQCRKVAAAVQQLPDWLKQPVLLVVYQGLKYREAAAAIGIPMGTLKSRLSQAIRTLAATFDEPACKRRSA